MSQSIHDITENWYARLNKLKEYNQREDLTLNQKIRSQILILALADRLMRLVPHYINATQPIRKDLNAAIGGVAIVGESIYEPSILNKNESVVDHAKRIIKNYPISSQAYEKS